MENNYKNVSRIAQEGYALDFGIVFEKSFENFKKIWGIAGLSLLVISIVLMVVMFSIVGIIFGFSNLSESLTVLNPKFMSNSGLISTIIISSIFAGLFSPLNAGLIKMAHLATVNESYGLSTIFDYFKSSHFKELFISASIIALIGSGISYVLEYFGIKYIGNIITLIVSFFTVLTVPLIIFSNLKAFEALSMSFKLVAKSPFIILALLLVGFLFVMLGLFAFCIGLIFTMPFLYSLYYNIYKEIIPIENTDEIDEIGIF